VHEVRPYLAQHAAQGRPVKQVKAAIESDGLDAQVVRPSPRGGLQTQSSTTRFAPGGRGDDDQALDIGPCRDLIQLVAIRFDDQDFRDDQDAQRISL
jgi:hypothetical protein